jgi:ABC-type multidrug transport system fused ATPase/permease subunit
MLPRSLKDFLIYYWRFDPKRWMLFILHDLLHYTRYPICYLLVGKCVDILVHADRTRGIPGKAWLIAASIFIVLLTGEGAHIWTEQLLRKWRPRMRVKIRTDFFNYLLSHSHSYYQNNFAGALARKVTEIAESSVRLIEHLRFSLFGSIIMMTATAVGLLIISPWYGLMVVVFLVCVTLPVALRLKRIGGRARAFSEIRARVTGTIVDILTNASSMRNFARAPYERTVHDLDSNAEARADSLRMLTLIQIALLRRLCLIVLGGSMMAALLIGWHRGLVTVGEVSSVMGLTFALTNSTWMLGFGIVMVADELGYIDDAIRMVTAPHEITDSASAPALRVTEGRVTFENVNFNFGARPIFRDLNLDIRPGEKIGLLGPSGAGKSTLVSLLLRLHDIEGGRILIDGQNIAAVGQESLRASISLIPQDTALFHRTLKENIRYGSLDAADEQVTEAARRAHAHDFIAELADGYDTMVGERGIKLSGGQRQRVAIARAVLKSAPILLLDEATSALDSESEKVIQESLYSLMQGKTVIAIAHRLSTIAHMDRLIVMEQGRIVEQGSHAELVRAGGLYARLWSMQSGGFLGDVNPAIPPITSLSS